MTTADFCTCFNNPITATKKKRSYYSATLKVTYQIYHEEVCKSDSDIH